MVSSTTADKMICEKEQEIHNFNCLTNIHEYFLEAFVFSRFWALPSNPKSTVAMKFKILNTQAKSTWIPPSIMTRNITEDPDAFRIF